MRKPQNYQWDNLSLGVCYYPEHWDRSLWREDLRRMKESGIGTVRVAEFAWILHFGGTFTRSNVRTFLKYAGVLEPFADTISVPEECEIALRRKAGKDYLFVLNFDKKSKEIILNRNMVDMDSGETVTGSVSLQPYGTKVYCAASS